MLSDAASLSSCKINQKVARSSPEAGAITKFDAILADTVNHANIVAQFDKLVAADHQNLIRLNLDRTRFATPLTNVNSL